MFLKRTITYFLILTVSLIFIACEKKPVQPLSGNVNYENTEEIQEYRAGLIKELQTHFTGIIKIVDDGIIYFPSAAWNKTVKSVQGLGPGKMDEYTNFLSEGMQTSSNPMDGCLIYLYKKEYPDRLWSIQAVNSKNCLRAGQLLQEIVKIDNAIKE